VERPRTEWIAIPVPDLGVPAELVEAARESLKINRRPSSAGDRYWELSGGNMYCEGCGRRMSPDRRRNSSGSERLYFYYRCPKRRIDGPAACPNAKTQRAERAEEAVWEVVCALLTDPERLRRGLEELIERERNAAAGDPERQAEVWASRLNRIERKRANFQDMAAEGLITFDELRTKLGMLQSEHEQARSELEAVLRRKEKIAALERDAEELLESYAEAVPERLRELGPEERRRVYGLLRVRAKARCDGGLQVSGVLGAALGDSPLCVTTSQFPIEEDSRACGPKAYVACSIRGSGLSHT
jgi:hypothetical protein